MSSAPTELDKIFDTVALYQDGHLDFNAEILKKAFHSNAHVIGYDAGELMFVNRSESLSLLKSEEPSIELAEATPINIVLLDKTDTTAVVKIENVMVGMRYTSYLSMLKIDHEWPIVSGLYHAHENE